MKYYTVKELRENISIKELTEKGVYILLNIKNNRKYIGSTTRSFRTRWREIRKDCKKGKKISKYLSNEWNKYKEENFVFGVLEVTDQAEIAEAKWIKRLNPELNNIRYPTKYIKSKKVNKGFIYNKKLEEKGIKILEILEGVESEVISNSIRNFWIIETPKNKINISSLEKLAKDYLEGETHPQKLLTRKFIQNLGIKLTQQTNNNYSKYTKRNRNIYKKEKLDKIKESINKAKIPDQNINNPKWLIKLDDKIIYLKSIHNFININNIPFMKGCYNKKTLDPFYINNGLEIIKLYSKK